MPSVAANLVDVCPWCEAPVSRSKFVEIENRIHAAEAKKIDELHKKSAAEREALEKKAKAESELLKQKNEEQKEALEKLKAEKIAQEKTAKEAVDTAVAKALTLAAAESTRKQQTELSKARDALKVDFEKKALKAQAENERATRALNKKFLELQRKFDAKAANESAEGAEVDVYEALRAEFDATGDKITRVPKGQLGFDIIHRVSHRGVSCGTIVIDSRNRQSWQDAYATKLHEEQVAASADHAILATTVFPKGGRELLLKEEVLLVNPARVTELLRVLRQALIQLHTAKLSNEERVEKKARLYQYINSEPFRQKFAEVGVLAKNLLEVDVDEQKEHARVWKKRGEALCKLQTAMDKVETEIGAIVSGVRG